MRIKIKLFILSIMVLSFAGCMSDYKDYRARSIEHVETDYYISETTGIDDSADDEQIDLADSLKEIKSGIAESKKKWSALVSERKSIITNPVVAIPEAYRGLGDDVTFEKLIEKKLTPGLLEAAVLLRNPALKAAEENLRAGLEQYPQLINLEDLLSQYNAFTKQLSLKTSSKNHKDMVAMHFPQAGTLGLKGQLIDYDLKMRFVKMEKLQQEKIYQLRKLIYKVFYLSESIQKSRENIQLVEQAIKVVQKQLAAAKASGNMVVMLQLELIQLNERIMDLKDEHSIAISAINTLVARKLTKPLKKLKTGNFQEITESKETILNKILKSNQDFKMHELKHHKLAILIALNKKMYFPDPTINTSYLESKAGMKNGTQAEGFNIKKHMNTAKLAKISGKFSFVNELEISLKRHIKLQDNLTNDLKFKLNRLLTNLHRL